MDEKLARRIYEVAHLTGEFTLRSGAVSNEYFDKFLFEADPALLSEITSAMVPLVPDATEALAGLEMGGIPVVAVLSQKMGLPARFVRKKAKDYGTCRLAEGGDVKGLRLTIVEDVISSGGAVMDACRELRALGATVDTVVCVIDRVPPGVTNLADMGIEMRALFTMEELKAAASSS